MPRLKRPARLACTALAALALAAPAAATAAPGQLDTGFAGTGIFTAPFLTTLPGNEDAHSVAVDSQGRVYLSATQEAQLGGGIGLTRKVNVVRLSPQGVPDPGFGSGGTVTLPTQGDVRNAGIVVDAQDRPLILGYLGDDTGSYQILLTRLTTAGAPDSDFGGGDGVAVQAGLPPAGAPRPEGLDLTPSGQILVAGTLITAIKTGFIARFSSTGTLDTGYGTGGWTQIGDSGVEATAMQAIGGGAAFVGGWDDYAEWLVAKVDANGVLDPSFDGDGVARSSLGKASLDLVTAYGLTADGQGRPIVVGQFTSNTNGAQLAVMRWTALGAPDASFGSGTPTAGALFVPGAVSARGIDAAVQCSDNKVLVTGSAARPAPSGGNRVVLARLQESGALDPGFAAGAATPGVATVDSGVYNRPSDLALTSAGAYIAGFRSAPLTPMDIPTDYPQVLRIQASEGCASGPPPVTPPAQPGAGPVTPAAPVAPKPAAAALPAFSKLVTLPSAKSCVSRRNFSIRLRVPTGSSVVEATVNVNGKRVAVRRGKRLRSVVDLRTLPKGRFRVEVVLKLADGRKVRDNRRYRTCAPKRRR